MCKSGYYALSITIRREEKACGGLGTVLLGDAKDADRNPIVHSCPLTAGGLRIPLLWLEGSLVSFVLCLLGHRFTHG